MNRFWEILLGLDRGFLSREGDLSLQFHPNWPFAEILGNGLWNLMLVVAAITLVVYVYNREGKTRRWRLALGASRLAILLLLIALLNRPALTLTRARVEPSVLAVMVDDSVSMRIADVQAGEDDRRSRLGAAVSLLTADDAALLRELGEKHELRFFRFDRDAVRMEGEDPAAALGALEPTGPSTAVAEALRSALSELQGQNLAGVVLLTDGRDAPARPDSAALASVKQSGVRIYPVPVGGEQEPRNVEVQSVVAQDVAFAGDIVNIIAVVRAAGIEGTQSVRLALKDQDGNPVLNPDGSPVTAAADVTGGVPTEMELQLETIRPGTLQLVVEAEPDPAEIDADDNRRPVHIEVMDAKVTVLYVEGYPRWEYRFLKNQLIRDSTIDASMLLTSADLTFSQEGDRPIQRFPVTIDELLDYDVILLGDVSPQQFSDGQLQLIEEFVGDKGGGFAMMAGPRDSPWAWEGTPIERLLPIEVTVQPSMALDGGTIAEGFRPILTDAGRQSGMFRFERDRETNEEFLSSGIQPLFWFAEGIIAKPGVGEVLAQHAESSGPDGRPAPLVVAGRYGAGRTLFSGLDETWRWRYYTGEDVFDTYWVQQIRYLARGRKLGQRRLALSVQRPTYELGEQVQVELRLLDPALSRQLPDRLDLEIRNEQGQPVGTARLARRGEGAEADRYTASFPASRVGNFSVAVPPMGGQEQELTAPVTVQVPQMELDRPVVDRASLQRLAEDTGGQLVPLSDARRLPELIPSVEKRIPIISDQALWDAPLALALFALLITMEWIGRKAAGLI
jgi:uncharacterized membrane protein